MNDTALQGWQKDELGRWLCVQRALTYNSGNNNNDNNSLIQSQSNKWANLYITTCCRSSDFNVVRRSHSAPL